MQNELETIESVCAGNGKDFAQLVTRYHVGLIIHCERIVGDRDDAEDIAQEALISAYRKLDKYNARHGSFSTWLYKIATNLALDHLRKYKRKISVEDVAVIAESTMPTHFEEVQKDEIRQAVMRLMPPEYRQVIEAYYWYGKSYQQIATELGVPVNTVRTWLRRAKQQLKGDLL